MNLFDGIIDDLLKLLAEYHQDNFEVDLKKEFVEEKDQFFFKNDIGLSLGEGKNYGLSSTFISGNLNYVEEDRLTIIGDELNKIDGQADYARLVLAEVDDGKCKSSNEIYQLIRKIDYTRYHLSLKGMMIRISSMNKKESLVISKESLKKLTLKDIGTYMIQAYKKNPAIKKVHLILIDKKDFPYFKLEELMEKNENIIKALDHLANNIKMDCHSCALQVVCNEVEKKVQEDFKK